VIEVDRPNRRVRRRRGKSDTIDAEAAARSVLSGEATVTPKLHCGIVESIRVLRVALASARNGRARAANQIRDLIVTGPEVLRDQLGRLTTEQRVAQCARLRPGVDLSDPDQAVKAALRSLARRYQSLSLEMGELEARLDELTVRANAALRGAKGVGTDVASILLVAAGDNPERLRSEASFAALCGVSPVEASSGKTVRHRLNRAGNRQANHALWRMATVRLSCDPATKAREVYLLLTDPPRVPRGAVLRVARTARGLTLAEVVEALGTSNSYVSRIERGLIHDSEYAALYERWLSDSGVSSFLGLLPQSSGDRANPESRPAT
jgi:transposase